MTKEEFKNIKPGDIVVISAPRSVNNGRMGIVRFMEINDIGAGTAYLEPYKCEFETHRTMPVLRGEIIIYGFVRQQISKA